MKKIMAILILLMFSLSIMSVSIFAQETNQTENTQNDALTNENTDETQEIPDAESDFVIAGLDNDKNKLGQNKIAPKGATSTGIQTRNQICVKRVSESFPDISDVETKCAEMVQNTENCVAKLKEGGVEEEKADVFCNRYLAAPVVAAANIKERIQAMMGKFSEKVDERIARINNNSQLSEEQKEKMIGALEKFSTWGDEKLQKLDDRAMYRLRNLETQKVEKIKELSSDDVEKFVNSDRATQKKLINLTKEQMKIQLEKYKIVKAEKKEDLFLKRQISEEKVQLYRQMYKNYMQEFNDDKEELNDLKKKFLELRKDNSSESLQAAKDYLNKAIDLIINELNVVLSKAKENDDLTDTEVAKIEEKINEKISDLNVLKEKINNAQSKEEIKELAKDIDWKWKQIKTHVRTAQDAIKNSKIGEVVVRSKYLEIKLDKILSRMEEKGVDTSSIDEKVEEFSQKIASAQEKYDKAKSLINEILNKKTSEETIDENANKEEIKSLMSSAHEDLNSAHEILKEIAKTLKANNESLESEDEDVDEEISIVEENDDLINQENSSNTEVEGTQ